MCFNSSSKSSSTSVPQSLNLGSGNALEFGNAPNLQNLTLYLAPPTTSTSPLQSIAGSPFLPYLFLLSAGYIAYRMLR
jgi:hypothetical protein